ncbi:hypothetical protein Dfri01_39410 [Dyadobacter frigoris]|uniref:hypothetical protein n=1 Tax=Dyadobacter frigoris TaxID=2576211 RepID=UPI0024A48D2A|nr:hypothetical protein [Dyadobacter frigoris]GLU54480.1 hypothetical protein Dfri01_39410 [Dyadobacter frigoris]
MIQFAELTDEEFELIKKGLDLLANDDRIAKTLFKGLLISTAPNGPAKADMERMFKEDEERERRAKIDRNDKITTIQYKLIQLKRFQAAKPGIASEAVASEN